MNDDLQDPILGLLARLPSATPSPARAELVRARSHLALEKKLQQSAAPRRTPAERAVDAALYLACVVYIAAAAIEAVKLGWPLR